MTQFFIVVTATAVTVLGIAVVLVGNRRRSTQRSGAQPSGSRMAMQASTFVAFAAALLTAVVASAQFGLLSRASREVGSPAAFPTYAASRVEASPSAIPTMDDPASPPDQDPSGSESRIHLAAPVEGEPFVKLAKNVDNAENIVITGDYNLFPHAWTLARPSGTAASNPNGTLVAQITLGQSFSSFTATLGLDIEGQDGAGTIYLVADGKIIRSETASQSDGSEVTVSVAGIQRLEIFVKTTQGRPTFAVGDPTISG